MNSADDRSGPPDGQRRRVVSRTTAASSGLTPIAKSTATLDDDLDGRAGEGDADLLRSGSAVGSGRTRRSRRGSRARSRRRRRFGRAATAWPSSCSSVNTASAAGEPEPERVAVEHDDQHHEHARSPVGRGPGTRTAGTLRSRLRPIVGACARARRAADRSGGCASARRLAHVPYVYAFDHKHRRPPMELQGPPRWQGRQPRRDDQRARSCRCRRASRSPPTPAAPTCTAAGPTGLDDEIAKHVVQAREGDGPQARRPVRPAARQRALGRQVLDAGDDGHRPQPRPQRRERRRAWPRSTDDERFAYDSLPPLHRHVRPHRARRRRRAVRAPARGGQGSRPASTTDAELPADGAQGRCASTTRPSSKADRASRSRRTRASSCAAPSRPCSSSWNGARAIAYRVREKISHDLGTAVNVQTMVFGNRDDNSRHRRRLHPQRGHRREQAVRRLPRQRPGRGRGGRHPQHRGPRRT